MSSLQILEDWYTTFSTFIINNKKFKVALINTFKSEISRYDKFLARIFEFIDEIEKYFDLLYDAASSVYYREKYSTTTFDTGDTTMNFTENNKVELEEQARVNLYIPFLTACWEITAALRAQSFNNYENLQKFPAELSAIYEAMRGIEKNILGLLSTLEELK